MRKALAAAESVTETFNAIMSHFHIVWSEAIHFPFSYHFSSSDEDERTENNSFGSHDVIIQGQMHSNVPAALEKRYPFWNRHNGEPNRSPAFSIKIK